MTDRCWGVARKRGGPFMWLVSGLTSGVMAVQRVFHRPEKQKQAA